MTKVLYFSCFIFSAFLSLAPAFAAETPPQPLVPLQGQITAPAADAFQTKAKEAILIDMTAGTVLYDKNADQRMPTSSMSKILTAYLVFEALQDGRLTSDKMLPVSDHAWSTQGSKMFVPAHGEVKVEDLLRGVIIQSGNDACIVLAEGLAGSEPSFADAMNKKAAELGLKNSHFMNATGLPDPDHYSTARDLAVLASHVIHDFPQYYHFFSEQEFTYNNIKQGNRNPLLYRNMGVDGVKTGHTDDGGYGMIGSLNRDAHRLIVVVNGLDSMQARADESAALLEWGERTFAFYTLAQPDHALARAKVALGTSYTVDVSVSEPVSITLARRTRPDLKVTVALPDQIAAPISKGQQIGLLRATAPGMATLEVPLVAMEPVAELGFWGRVKARLKNLSGKETA